MDFSIPDDFEYWDYIETENPDILELISLGIWTIKLIKKQKLTISNDEDNKILKHEQDTILQDIRHEIVSLTSLVGGGTIKGKITERIILDTLTRLFPSAEIDDTGYTAGVGDISFEYNNNKIMIEVKNYKKNVPRAEQEKFIRDLTENKFDAGILVSCSSGIANRLNQWEYELVNGKFTIYLSNAGIEGGAIAWAILFITKANQLISELLSSTEQKKNLIFLQIKSELTSVESCINNNIAIISALSTMKNKIIRALDTQIKSMEHLVADNDVKLKLLIDNFTQLADKQSIPVNMNVLKLNSKDNPSLESMKVTELRSLAASKSISTIGLKKKAIIEAIRADSKN